jgi:hypothetical protein
MEMMYSMWAPRKDGETFTFVAPLDDGAVPMIHLDDLGRYARWIFDNIEKSSGTQIFDIF